MIQPGMPKTLKLPPWLPSQSQRRAREEQLKKKYFVVRISGNAGYDTMKCTRCGCLHSHLTLMCRTQPFSGATRGIYLYMKTFGAQGLEAYMDPVQKERFARAAELFKQVSGLPDFATSHPQTARGMDVSIRDGDIGAIQIGQLEEISKVQAQQLLDEINGTGLKPPLEVPGLRTELP
jgi:hypothetical protein